MRIGLPVLGQSGTTFTGSVQDGAGKPLPYVTVAFFTASDTTRPAKATATDVDGRFQFERVRAGLYLVRATAVGFQRTQSAPINVAAAPVTIPALTLTEATGKLAEVQVVAKKPFVEQQIDRMVINVAGSIVGSGSTALEVLEKSPGVTVDYQNDRLQLRGKDGVIVQIDGRQTYLSPADAIALLRSMSSDNVATIELITNPGSRYDAAGNSGIINIRLKKNANLGTNGTLSGAGGSGRFDRERGSLQLNHRTQKLNLFGNYSLNRGGNYWDFQKTTDQANPSPSDPNRRTFSENFTYLPSRDLGQNAKAGLDFMPAKNTTIGAVWTGFWSDHSEIGAAGGTFRRVQDGPVYLQTSTQKTYTTSSQNQIGNLNLQHSFGEKKGTLTADVDLGHFSRSFSNQLSTQVLVSDGVTQPSGLLTIQPTTIDIFTAKTDYTRPLTKGWKLEAGLKTATVKTDNDLTLSSGPPDSLVRDPNFSTQFRYTEHVTAGYASVSGNWHGLDVQAGLRAEHTFSEGNALTSNQVVTRRYLNLFPSLFLTRSLTGGQTLTGSYSYRIDRPNYQDLNPSRGYVDPYTYRQGNAFLRPQYTHALEVKYGLKNGLFASLGMNYITDLFNSLLFATGGNTSYIMTQNIGHSQGYTATLGWPVPVMQGWQLQTNWLVLYNRYQFDYEGTPVTVQNVAGRLNATNAFTFGKGWTGELNGRLSTPAVNVAFRSPWLGSVDMGVQKNVSAMLKLKLSVQDVFHMAYFRSVSDLPGNRQTAFIQFDTRIALLNLTYSFGNQQVKAAGQRRTASEDETKRAN